MGSPVLAHERQCSPVQCIIILVIFQDAVLASRFLAYKSVFTSHKWVYCILSIDGNEHFPPCIKRLVAIFP